MVHRTGGAISFFLHKCTRISTATPQGIDLTDCETFSTVLAVSTLHDPKLSNFSLYTRLVIGDITYILSVFVVMTNFEALFII